MKKIWRSLIAVILVFSLFTGGYPLLLNTLADALEGTLYVSDVQMFQASTLDECIELCEKAGYKPFKHNLNDGTIEKVKFGSDIDAPCVILGYTTTTNVNLAVTDISLLRMGEGYELREYQAVAAAMLAKNQNYAEGLAAAAQDFAENYDKGAPCAIQAYKMLDLLYVDDPDNYSMNKYVEEKNNDYLFHSLIDTFPAVKEFLQQREENSYKEFDREKHMPLSEYILDGNADDEFFGKLLSFGTPSIISAVNSALCTGSAEYMNSYNPETDEYETSVWAERIYNSDVRDMISEGLTSDEWRTFDSAYMDTARQLSSAFQDFATQYLNAKARGSTFESMGDTEATDLDGVIEEAEQLEESDIDGVYLAAYEILNHYKYDDKQLLGDWIVSAGRRAYSSDEDYRSLYVLADVFTPAQLIMIKYCGFATFADKMLQPEEESAESNEVFQTLINGLKKLVDKGEEYRVCVWMGVEKSLYYGKIGMTSDAIRQAGANAALQLTQEEKDAENSRLRSLYIAIGSGAITVLTIIVEIAVHVKAASLLKLGIETGVAAAGTFWSLLTSYSSIITKLNIYLLIAEVVITIVVFLYNYVKNELHDPSSDYTDMPSLLYESKKTSNGVRVVKYNAVTEPYRGRIGDLNAYEGNKWNLLYLSHDSDAGSPVVVPDGKDPFYFKTNDSSTPEGYQPLAQFGQLTAADLNVGAYEVKKDQKNFLFYATEKSQNGSNTGETASSGKYIGDLKLFTADTVERCKAKITTASGNYLALDYNLGTATAPCYIGYSLTDQENNAVKDIRFFVGENASSLTFGGAEYTLSGELPSGGGVYISRSSLVGTPIGSELSCIKSPEDAPEGWEPIIHFSGAPVALFGEKGEQFAIYFEPKVKYTQGNPYVGGFCFYQADYQCWLTSNDKPLGADDETQRKESVEEMLSILRWQKGGIATDLTGQKTSDPIPDTATLTEADIDNAVDLCSALSYQGAKNTYAAKYNVVKTHLYLIYSLTYNPYRAIRDVALYSTATANNNTLFTTLSKELVFYQNGVEKKANGGYVVCDDHYTQTANDMYTGGTFRASHAYISQEERGNTDSPARQDGGVYDWDYVDLLMRGLYVLGPVEGMDPLNAADVVLSSVQSDAVNEDGNIVTRLPSGCRNLLGENAEGRAFHSVQDIKYPYNEIAQNLSYPALATLGKNPIEASTPLYMYLHECVHKPKYISGVTVGAYTEERFKQENPDAGSTTRAYMNALSEDMAWRNALAGSNSGIIPTNLIVPEGEAWYSVFYSEENSYADYEYDPNCCYIGVSRTDDVSKAITGMLLVKKEAVEPGSAPITQIVVGGASSIETSGGSGTGTTYYLAQGSNSIPLKDGDYYLYYSYNPAATPGSPLTDIAIDGEAFKSGMSTVLSSNDRGKEAKLFGNTNVEYYIHMKYEYTQGSMFNAFYIGTGDNLDAALLDLLSQGAVEAAPVDINQGAGDIMALGWRTMSVSDEDIALHNRNKGKTSDPLREAIRDMILTIDEPYKDTLIHNGVVYKPVSKMSLNSGNEGNEIYLYTCTDYDTWAYNIGKPASEQLRVPSLYSDYASPLSRVGLAKGDRVPYNSKMEGAGDDANLVRWENVLTTKGNRLDLNHGSILISSNGRKLLENRMYLFAHRADNSVKKGAEITGGFVSDTEKVSRLYGLHEDWGKQEWE